MSRIARFITIIMLTAPTLVAQEYVVQVDNTKYTANEIRSVMKNNAYPLPDLAVAKLARDAAERRMGAHQAKLYREAFGSDLPTDSEVMASGQNPDKADRAFSKKQFVDAWLERKSSTIAVKYIAIERYWEIVMETPSHKARAAAGMRIGPASIPYTFAELQVRDGTVLARKRGAPLLEAREYNEYVTVNYAAIQALARRDRPVSEVKERIARLATEQQLVADAVDTKRANLDDAKLERIVESFVNASLFDDTPEFAGLEQTNPDAMHRELMHKYEKRHTKDIDQLKRLLKGDASIADHPFRVKLYVRMAKLEAKKQEIAKRIPDYEVTAWAKQNHFPGSMSEALSVMTKREFDDQVRKLVETTGVTFSKLD